MTIEEAARNSNNVLEKELGDNRDGSLEYAQLREGVIDWHGSLETKDQQL